MTVLIGSGRATVNALRASSPESVRAHEAQIGGVVELSEKYLVDLDAIDKWMRQWQVEPLDSNVALDAWNFFIDVSDATDRSFDGKFTIEYDKLFASSDTGDKIVKPPGEPSYDPEWTTAELQAIRDVMSDGLAMFNRVVAPPL